LGVDTRRAFVEMVESIHMVWAVLYYEVLLWGEAKSRDGKENVFKSVCGKGRAKNTESGFGLTVLRLSRIHPGWMISFLDLCCCCCHLFCIFHI